MPFFTQSSFAATNRRASFSSARCVRRGFTLIEIIVVIAIVLVLAAILLPVFTGARETARTATCSNNLKQIGFAIDQYVQDSGGFYPDDDVAKKIKSSCAWPVLIFPYLKSAELLQCPSFERGEYLPDCPPSEPIIIKDEPSQYENWDGSYDLSANSDFQNNGFLVSAVRVRNPSSRILSYDGMGSEATLQHEPLPSLETLNQKGYNRHRDGLNALFFDGHIKWIALDHVYDAKYWSPKK